MKLSERILGILNDQEGGAIGAPLSLCLKGLAMDARDMEQEIIRLRELTMVGESATERRMNASRRETVTAPLDTEIG